MINFASLEDLASWLNQNEDNIADGLIRWSTIQSAIEAAGWQFNTDSYWIAYDNNTRQGVHYEIQRNGHEIAVVE